MLCAAGHAAGARKERPRATRPAAAPRSLEQSSQATREGVDAVYQTPGALVAASSLVLRALAPWTSRQSVLARRAMQTDPLKRWRSGHLVPCSALSPLPTPGGSHRAWIAARRAATARRRLRGGYCPAEK